MGLEPLKLFRDISQHRSVSRGAQLNSISQSAASQCVQELERTLEVVLLDRATRPISLTPAGKLYHEFCRDVLRRHEEFTAALERLKEATEGTVRVASIYSVGLSEMTRLEHEFSERYPQAVLKVDYLRPEKVYEAVERDEADLGLVSYPEPTKDIAVEKWRTEEMVLAMAPGHRLAGRAEIVPADLEGEAFIGFDEDLPIRRHVDRFLKEHGVEVRAEKHFDNIQMIKEAVAVGAGVSIIPARLLDPEIELGRVVASPLAPPGLQRPLGIVFRRRKTFNRAAEAFRKLLQEPELG